MGFRYFFDIPVYRLTEDVYNRKRTKYIEGMARHKDLPFTEAIRAKETAEPFFSAAFQDHRYHSYGGCWRFNEIVGYIRLHFLGSQVRGEYYGVRKQRIVRTRTKTFEYQTWKLASEIDIPYPYTNEVIFEAVRNYLEACRKELPRRFVDVELFEVVGKHVHWCNLFAEGKRQRPPTLRSITLP